MEVIADFPAYPEWAEQVKTVEVLDSDAAGRAEQVRFTMDAGPIKDTYTLDYTLGPGRPVGQLDPGQGAHPACAERLLRAVRQPGADHRHLLASVDLNIPMIGMLRRKAEKVIIDTALKGLKRRVESIS